MSYTGSSGCDANNYTDPEPLDITLCQGCKHVTVEVSHDPDNDWPTVYCSKRLWEYGDSEPEDCSLFQAKTERKINVNL